MTIALISAAAIAGLFAYAAIGAYVVGICNRLSDPSDQAPLGTAALWPILLLVLAVWITARRLGRSTSLLQRIHRHALTPPAKRREQRIAARQAKASKAALARAIVRQK
jgi:hypothetical protein